MDTAGHVVKPGLAPQVLGSSNGPGGQAVPGAMSCGRAAESLS